MEEYFLKNRKENIIGNRFKEGEIITGIIFNPVDYVLDGIKFINTEKIENVAIKTNNFKDKVMMKKIQIYFDEPIKKIIRDSKTNSFEELFTVIESLDLLCELSLSEEDVVYIGKIIDVYEDSIDVDFFDTECNLMDNAYVEYENITTVTIFSDYLDSLSEVMKST
ncbi:hypothetical protein [Chryseobacterium fistulae]|uniref:Uncharacterized protein n=1 Tax=Chryseobacterium fistulae TaxID=2675058 RepID=A0A6N4XLK3_9FLAO|nr:hypothetical protein [Chryseobacterium fistulae]CAA7386637.1 hypothetical protein CHRY9393_00934 [Chryseobacterium fistulae]